MSLIDTDILKREIYKLKDEQCDNLEKNEVISEVITVIDFLSNDIPCSKCSNKDKLRIIQDNNVCSKCEAYSHFNLELEEENEDNWFTEMEESEKRREYEEWVESLDKENEE